MVMHINFAQNKGFTLIETIVFITVVSIALGTLIKVFNQGVSRSVEPIVKIRLLELAQSKLDEVIARKYDHNTPSGGVPACNSDASAALCTAAIGREGAETCAMSAEFNDVDDFDGCSDMPYPNYTRTVAISYAGTDLGLATTNAKRLQVTVSLTDGEVLILSSYRANF